MKKRIFLISFLLLISYSTQAPAAIQDGLKMLAEGAVEAPVGLVKLVGGLLITVGEVLIFPFRFFGV